MVSMIESIKKDWRVKVLIVLFILLTFWWKLSPEMTKPYADGFGFQFSYIYFLVALFGALSGLIAMRHLQKSSDLSRAQLFFSLGLLCQVFGQVSYAYYDAAYGIVVPYPSIGDIGYFLHIPFYLIGIFYLARTSKTSIWLQSFENKFQAVTISVVTLVTAYGLFLHGYVFDWAHPLTVFLNFAYPFGQAVYVCIGILAYLAVQADQKNLTKNLIFLALMALVIQFLCDYMFVYEASRGTWVTGGNNDYLYLISYFVMGFTVLRLDSLNQKSR